MSTAGHAVSDLTDVGSPIPKTPLRAFLRKPMNWLLLCIPLTVALEHLAHVSRRCCFSMAALAIVPIARRLFRPPNNSRCAPAMRSADC
jgi:hypothetical protein